MDLDYFYKGIGRIFFVVVCYCGYNDVVELLIVEGVNIYFEDK